MGAHGTYQLTAVRGDAIGGLLRPVVLSGPGEPAMSRDRIPPGWHRLSGQKCDGLAYERRLARKINL